MGQTLPAWLLATFASVACAQGVVRTSFPNGRQGFTASGKVELSDGVLRVEGVRVLATGPVRVHLERLVGSWVRVEVERSGWGWGWVAVALSDPAPAATWVWTPLEPESPMAVSSRASIDPDAPLSRLLARQRGRVTEVRAYRYQSCRPLVPVGLAATTAGGMGWIVAWDEARGVVTLAPDGPGPQRSLPLAQVQIGVERRAAPLTGRVEYDSSHDLFLLRTGDGSLVELRAAPRELLPALEGINRRHLEVVGVELAPASGLRRVLVLKSLNLTPYLGDAALTGKLDADINRLETEAGTFELADMERPRSAPPENWVSALELARRLPPGIQATLAGWEIVEPGIKQRQLIVSELRATDSSGVVRGVQNLWVTRTPGKKPYEQAQGEGWAGNLEYLKVGGSLLRDPHLGVTGRLR